MTIAPPVTRDGSEFKATIQDTPGMRMLYSAQNHLDDAVERLNLDPNLHKILRTCERSLAVSVPIMTDDGNIEVYSEPGKGSEFVVTLPLK